MIKAILMGPYVNDASVSFQSEPMVGDSINVNGMNYKIIRRGWIQAGDGFSLRLTVELA